MKLLFLALCTILSICNINIKAIAQITPDNTLGQENSRVSRNRGRNLIEGGAKRGNNLFHSFQKFSVKTGKNTYFANPTGVQNIFTRVTGNNVSKIFGTLGVLGEANLFLINPNGILFGNNTKLDLKGSFFASSADSIVFDNGFNFSASQPESPPLLTVNIPLGLRLRDGSGNIAVKNSSLKLQKGQSLSLLGGNILIDNAQLQAPEGAINLGAVGDSSLVAIEQSNLGYYKLNYKAVKVFRDISVSGQKNVNSSDFGGTLIKTGGQRGGMINLQGRNINLSGKTLISSNTRGNQSGSEVIIRAEDLALTEGAGIFANTGGTSQGNGSNINVQVDNLLIRDQSIVSTIATNAFGEGKGGNLTLKASESIKLLGGNGIFTFANSKGDAGNLTITTPILKMTNGVQVGSLASLDGKGKAGDVRVHSSDSIKLLGGSAIASQALRGDGGNLEIITNELIAKDASQIGTSTFGQGNSGDLFVKARLIKLIGTDGTSNIFPSGFFSAVNIDEDNPNNRAGNGGQLTIETDKLLLSDGAQILTSARSTGNAGDLTINAADSITIRGTDPKATLIKGQSAILAAIEPAAKINEQVVISTGESGSIDITTDRLIIEDGGKISADTFGPNNAGNINLNINNLIIQKGGLVQAGSLIESPEENVNLLPDGSPNLERGKGGNITINAASSVEITGRGTVGDGAKKIPVNSQILVAAEGTGEAGNLTINTGNLTVKSGGEINGRTASGTGGNIDLNVSDIILLKNSPIIATADNNGDGGNITINTDFLIAEDGGRINADAKEGTGGNINITAESVFLDAPIDERITASSERGIDGVVEINTPDIDPTKGLLQFSSDVVDAADLIARNVCEKGRDSKYIVTGKGGIPSNPNELLDTDNDVVEVNLIEPLPVNESESSPKPRSQNNQVKSRVIPARGWIFNDRGEGVLVGYDPTLASPQREDKPRVCDRDE